LVALAQARGSNRTMCEVFTLGESAYWTIYRLGNHVSREDPPDGGTMSAETRSLCPFYSKKAWLIHVIP
jgi:hypothetical protein